MDKQLDTREFDAMLTKLTDFVEGDAIPIANAIAQEQLRRQALPIVNKPSIESERKLRKKGVSSPLQAPQQQLDHEQIAIAVRNGLQDHLNRIL